MTILQEAVDMIELAKDGSHCKVPGCMEEAHGFGLLCQKHETEAQEATNQ